MQNKSLFIFPLGSCQTDISVITDELSYALALGDSLLSRQNHPFLWLISYFLSGKKLKPKRFQNIAQQLIKVRNTRKTIELVRFNENNYSVPGEGDFEYDNMKIIIRMPSLIVFYWNDSFLFLETDNPMILHENDFLEFICEKMHAVVQESSYRNRIIKIVVEGVNNAESN